MLIAELFLEVVIVLRITRNNDKFMDLLKVGDSEWAERIDVMFVANFVAIVIK